MAISRRALLRTGAASILVSGAGGAWLFTRTSAQAREPWQAAAAGFGDPRLDALAYAILAPNPHNMQPWQIRLDGEDSFTLFARADRLLPETDPPGRQITIGFGCFLELFRQAAAEKGYLARVTAFPEGEPQPTLDQRPVARVSIASASQVEAEPLFAYALARRTQRTPFDTDRAISSATLDRICAAATPGVAVASTVEPARRDALRELTAKAWTAEWENASAREETVRLTRIGKAEVEAQPWGITLDGALMSTLGSLGLVSRDGMRSPGNVAYEEGLSSYLTACQSAMAHIWSSTAGNTRQDQLNAGATWVRLHQAAAREGLAFHPLSQALQEFPAMAMHYRRAHEQLAAPGHTLQMLSRLGYAPGAIATPREPLVAKLQPA